MLKTLLIVIRPLLSMTSDDHSSKVGGHRPSIKLLKGHTDIWRLNMAVHKRTEFLEVNV